MSQQAAEGGPLVGRQLGAAPPVTAADSLPSHEQPGEEPRIQDHATLPSSDSAEPPTRPIPSCPSRSPGGNTPRTQGSRARPCVAFTPERLRR